MFLASLIPLAKDSIKDSSLSVKLSMYFSICNRRVLFTKLLAGKKIHQRKHEVTIQGHKELVCWGVALYFQY